MVGYFGTKVVWFSFLAEFFYYDFCQGNEFDFLNLYKKYLISFTLLLSDVFV